jgi:hypothetical protein
MSTTADLYLGLMKSMRARLDMINTLEAMEGDAFSIAETAAFHGRKVVEGIAFACLVATEHGLKHVPRDAKGKWNAEDILKSLLKKNLQVFPSPSVIRLSSSGEHASTGAKATIEELSDQRLTHDDLIATYQRLHRWLHELNPYVSADREAFYASHGQVLWDDLRSLNRFIERHFISIRGEAFFCILRDKADGDTKIVSLSKNEPQ